MSDEKILFISERMRLYNRKKPTESRIGTYLGKLIITSERFMFLSTGSGKLLEIISTKFILGKLLGELVLGETLTKDLNLEALENEGSLNLKLDEIIEIKNTKKFPFVKFLALVLKDREICFMQDGGGFSAPELKQIEVIVTKLIAPNLNT